MHSTTLIASLLFVVTGLLLVFGESMLFYMDWYSGVEYEPPLTQAQRVLRWVRVGVVFAAVIAVFATNLAPGILTAIAAVLPPDSHGRLR